MRKMTPPIIEACLREHTLGVRTVDLASRYNVSVSCLHGYFNAAGLPPSPKVGAKSKLTPEQLDKAVQGFLANENVAHMAKALGVSEGALHYHFKKAGLPSRGRTGRPIVSGPDQSHYPCGMCKETLPREAFGKNSSSRGVRPVAYVCKMCSIKKRAMSQYKITKAQYELIHSVGACQVCGATKPEKRSLFIDHDHSCGTIRGLLCEPCNSALGSAKERLEVLQKAQEYLQKPIEAIPEAPEVPLRPMRKWRLKKVFNVTPAQYAGMLLAQSHKCPICSMSLVDPMVDHCHRTGRTRGLLCWDCNILLGKVKDSVQVLEKLINYLKAPPNPLKAA